MARRIVTEKTLELNISAEILRFVRQFYKRAYLEGPSTRQERWRAYDSKTRGISRGKYIIFQIKSPWREYPPSTFSVNIRQLSILRRRSQQHPNGVWYLFPPYQTFKKIWLNSPNLLENTYFVRPTAFPVIQKKYLILDFSSPGKIRGKNVKKIEVMDFNNFKDVLTFSLDKRNAPNLSKQMLSLSDIEKIDLEMEESKIKRKGMQILCIDEEYEGEEKQKGNGVGLRYPIKAKPRIITT